MTSELKMSDKTPCCNTKRVVLITVLVVLVCAATAFGVWWYKTRKDKLGEKT